MTTTTFSFSFEDKAKLAQWLFGEIGTICDLHGVLANVSPKLCEESIDRANHDILRLSEGKNAGQIHPAKYIGYICFWVRKLKPVSDAFPIAATSELRSNPARPLDHRREVHDINEKITISLMICLLEEFYSQTRISEEINEDKFFSTIENVLLLGSDVGQSEGTIRDSLLYDMRYRTFGPHHLVHFVFNIIAMAKMDLAKSAR